MDLHHISRSRSTMPECRKDAGAEIRALVASDLPAAADVLAQGMRDNSLHVQVFGLEPALREGRLLRFLGPAVAYVHANGVVLGAYVGGELAGVLGMTEPGRCRPPLKDAIQFARSIASSFPPVVILRIARWLAAWRRNDPTEPHWHIGPLAVLPTYRRKGIGQHLMLKCCERLDELSAIGYLETDTPENVSFYEKLGFTVTGQEAVLGVPNWFMKRAPTRPKAG